MLSAKKFKVSGSMNFQMVEVKLVVLMMVAFQGGVGYILKSVVPEIGHRRGAALGGWLAPSPTPTFCISTEISPS